MRGVEESPASRYVPAAHGAHAPTTATPPIEREVASSRYSPPPHVDAHAPRAASWALPVGQVTRRARRGEGAVSDAKDKSDAGGCASTGSADDDAPKRAASDASAAPTTHADASARDARRAAEARGGGIGEARSRRAPRDAELRARTRREENNNHVFRPAASNQVFLDTSPTKNLGSCHKE